MNVISLISRGGLIALLAGLAFAATASAAAPVATTGGVRDIGPGGATLAGSVDANGERTRFYFEYGTTRRYGSRTAEAAAGAGGAPRQVTARVEGLAPNTRYHFRLVASNPSGVDSGADKTFRTRPQPLGLQITATPNPVAFGAPTTVTGALSGTGNANKQVVLQQRAFPFTAEFAQVGNPVVTDDNGAFAFPVLPLPGTTQFRVQTVDKPTVESPVLTLGVAALVRTTASRKSVRRNRRTRIHGTVRPARLGLPVEIQKRTKLGQWVVVRRALTRRGSDDTFVRYSKRLRVPRTAVYRVFVNAGDGDIVSGFGPETTVRVKRR
jgi:hypothetical protein